MPTIKELISQIPWDSPVLWSGILYFFAMLFTSFVLIISGYLERKSRAEKEFWEGIGHLMGNEAGMKYSDSVDYGDILDVVVDTSPMNYLRKRGLKKFISRFRSELEKKSIQKLELNAKSGNTNDNLDDKFDIVKEWEKYQRREIKKFLRQAAEDDVKIEDSKNKPEE